jgi:hypothetical protein
VGNAPAGADRSDLSRLVGRLGAKPVIDRDGYDAKARRPPVAPCPEKPKQRQRIAAARNRNDDALAPFEAEAFEEFVDCARV